MSQFPLFSPSLHSQFLLSMLSIRGEGMFLLCKAVVGNMGSMQAIRRIRKRSRLLCICFIHSLICARGDR